MASKTFNRSRPWNLEVNPSPDTMFHFPASPSEPGKFDFYRVHLANQACYSDSTVSDNSDAPVLTVPTTTTTTTRRWTPFADIVPSEQVKSSILPNSTSTSQTRSSVDSSVSSNTNSKSNEPISSAASFPSLTDVVKNAMNKGQLGATSDQIRRPSSGTTLSTKDLNHLSPQSM